MKLMICLGIFWNSNQILLSNGRISIFVPIKMSNIITFPLRFWNFVEIPNFDENARFFSKNASFPLRFWFLIQIHDYQQNLSGNAIISDTKFQNSCVMTHRIVRFLSFSDSLSFQEKIDLWKLRGRIWGENDASAVDVVSDLSDFTSFLRSEVLHG